MNIQLGDTLVNRWGQHVTVHDIYSNGIIRVYFDGDDPTIQCFDEDPENLYQRRGMMAKFTNATRHAYCEFEIITMEWPVGKWHYHLANTNINQPPHVSGYGGPLDSADIALSKAKKYIDSHYLATARKRS